MLSRFKKFGKSLEKAGKSVGKSFDTLTKASDAKSKSKKDSESHKAEDTSAAGADTASQRSAVSPSAGATTTHTPAENKSTASADAAPAAPSDAQTPNLSTATPPLAHTPASSGLEITMQEDDDDAGKSATSAPAPPPRTPPRVPTTRGGPGRSAAATPTSAAAASANDTFVRSSSGRAASVASHLSVHGSEQQQGEEKASTRSGVPADSSGRETSIRFDMDDSHGSPGTPPLPPRSPPRSRSKNAAASTGSAGLVVPRETSSVVFQVATNDSDDGEGGARKQASSPVQLEHTVGTVPDRQDSDDLNFVMDDDSSSRGGTKVNSVEQKQVVVDVDAPSEAAVRTAARRRSSKGESSRNRSPSDTEDAATATDDKKSPRNASSSRRARRKSSEDAEKRRGKHTSDRKKNDRADEGTRIGRRRRSSPGGKDSGDREERDGDRKTRTGSRARRGKARAAAASPPQSSQDTPSPSSPTSRSASLSQSLRDRDGGRRRSSSLPEKRHTSRRGSSPTKRGSGRDSRRRTASTHSDASSYRSGRGRRTQAQVSADVRKIFDQCNLDANGATGRLRGRRQRQCSPPHYSTKSHGNSRDVSPWGRHQYRTHRDQFTTGHRGDDRRSRSDSLGSTGSQPRHIRSPRGKYSGVPLMRYTYGSHESCSSGEDSYTSYDSRQREYYRGRPRHRARRSPPMSYVSAGGYQDDLVASLPPSASSSRQASPWRQERERLLRGASPSRSAQYVVERSPMHRRSRYASPAAAEFRVAARRSQGTPSADASLLTEDAILDEVEYKLEVLAEQIAYQDFTRERDMLSSPFERLYHMNNPRDRRDRRELLKQFNKLQSIREKILTGELDREIQEKEERQRRQQEMLRDPNSVFMRLYQSPRRRGEELEQALSQNGGRASANTSLRGGSPSRNTTTTSAQRITRTRAEQEEYFRRVHASAVANMRRKQEEAEAAQKEREEREYEDLLVARLASRMLRSSPPRSRTRALSPEMIMEQARAKILAERKAGDEDKLAKDLLRGRRITREEEERMAQRLTKHGLVPREALEKKRKQRELEECTFKPKINTLYASAARDDRSAAGGSRDGRDDGYDDYDDDDGRESYDSRTRGKPDRFEQLYRKGMAAKERAMEEQGQRDRNLRLKILKSRLSEDHHFRRRVELDPALAERFMQSLQI